MRHGLIALAAALALSSLSALVAAATLYSIIVSPLVATAGQTTNFSVTATALSDELGCVRVSLPGSWEIESVGIPVATDGGLYSSSFAGTTVTVKAKSDGDRVKAPDSVTFTVRATPATAGVVAWSNEAYAKKDCTGTVVPGTPLAITVLPAPTPSPTPSPTPRPTATPTPSPTPTPRPTATPKPSGSGAAIPTSSPTPRPTATPKPSGSGAAIPTSSPTPSSSGPGESASGESASEDPAPTPSPSNSTAAGSSTPASPVSTSGPSTLSVAAFDDSAGGGGGVDFGIGVDVLALLGGPLTWIVPGAAVGVPGLLVILFIALQALGVLAWIPAVRRLGGDDERRPPDPA